MYCYVVGQSPYERLRENFRKSSFENQNKLKNDASEKFLIALFLKSNFLQEIGICEKKIESE